MREKWFLKSKTVWGAIIVFLPALLTLLGVESPLPLDSVAQAGLDMINAINEIVGLILIAIGRYDAPGVRLTIGTTGSGT